MPTLFSLRRVLRTGPSFRCALWCNGDNKTRGGCCVERLGMKGGERMLKMKRKTCRYTGNGTVQWVAGVVTLGTHSWERRAAERRGRGRRRRRKKRAQLHNYWLVGYIDSTGRLLIVCLVWLGERSPVSARFRNVSRAPWMRPDGV